MMDWTDRHCRAFHRALTGRALLYTEMVTAPAVIHGDRERLLGFDAVEHPVALQLGGSDPAQLAEAARIGAAFGYDEINLNVGCPSDRVQSGRFGACLMKEPELVADCMAAIIEAVDVPATVKCRIGVDDQDPAQSLFATVDASAKAGVSTFIVHARKAWLQGLSPKENRDVPPLDYALVRRLKRERPHLSISINGGIGSLDEAEAHLDDADGVALDGVMVGRAAYHTPWILSEWDELFFGQPARSEPLTREAVEAEMVAYVEREMARTQGWAHGEVRWHQVIRHILGPYNGLPGARRWRQVWSDHTLKHHLPSEVMRLAHERPPRRDEGAAAV